MGCKCFLITVIYRKKFAAMRFQLLLNFFIIISLALHYGRKNSYQGAINHIGFLVVSREETRVVNRSVT